MTDSIDRLGAFMSLRARWQRYAALCVFLGCLSLPAHNAHADNLKIMELFTSHGCSSCPPADRLLGELLADDENLMALEFHVDYWNSLIHGSDGNFVDPFSHADFSMRQREYNVAKLSGRPGVYTPQTVINGRVAAVGSNRRHIMKALRKETAQELDIQISPTQSAETFLVTVRGSDSTSPDLEGIDISVASYLDKTTTTITGGENRNLVLDNHHVVTQILRLGAVSQESVQEFEISAPKAGEGCVVLVQEGAFTPIYAAAECP